MKHPFDIAADLDTPVSAFLKLGPLRPRFLLESVEGGERLGRYSFAPRDSVAVCWISIVRNWPNKPRNNKRSLYSHKLEISSVETLGGPPAKVQAPITREQLADMLLAVALEQIGRWRIPAEVFAPQAK